MRLLTPNKYKKNALNRNALKDKIDTVNVPVILNELTETQIVSGSFNSVNINNVNVPLSDLRNATNLKNMSKIANAITYETNSRLFRDESQGQWIAGRAKGIVGAVVGSIDNTYTLTTAIADKNVQLNVAYSTFTEYVTRGSFRSNAISFYLNNTNATLNNAIDYIKNHTAGTLNNDAKYLDILNDNNSSIPFMPFVRKANTYTRYDKNNPETSDSNEILTKWNEYTLSIEKWNQNKYLSLVPSNYSYEQKVSNNVYSYEGLIYYETVIDPETGLPSVVETQLKNRSQLVQTLKADYVNIYTNLKVDVIDSIHVRVYGTVPVALIYFAASEGMDTLDDFSIIEDSNAFIDYITNIDINVVGSVIDTNVKAERLFVEEDTHMLHDLITPLVRNNQGRYTLYNHAEETTVKRKYVYAFPNTPLLTKDAFYAFPNDDAYKWSLIAASSILYKYKYGKTIFKCTVKADWFLSQNIQLGDRVHIIGFNNNVIKKNGRPLLFQLRNMEAKYTQNEFVYELGFLEDTPRTLLYMQFTDNSYGELDLSDFSSSQSVDFNSTRFSDLLDSRLSKDTDEIKNFVLVGDTFNAYDLQLTSTITFRSLGNVDYFDIHNYSPFNTLETLQEYFPIKMSVASENETPYGLLDLSTFDNEVLWAVRNQVTNDDGTPRVLIDFIFSEGTNLTGNYAWKNSSGEVIIKIQNLYFRGTSAQYEALTFGTFSNPKDVCDAMYVWENNGWRLYYKKPDIDPETSAIVGIGRVGYMIIE